MGDLYVFQRVVFIFPEKKNEHLIDASLIGVQVSSSKSRHKHLK